MDDYNTDRRQFIGVGVIAAGVSALAESPAEAQPGAVPVPQWRPAAESLDSWLDKPGTRHRMMFDTVSADGAMGALGYANNFIHINQSDYGLTPQQLGVVIVFRHMSTPFGFNSHMWAKYGAKFADNIGLKGETAIRAASANPVIAEPASAEPPPKGMEWGADGNISRLAAKGVRFAVCGLATAGAAHQLAGKSGDAKAIEAELRANLVPGGIMVPAGIVAVNRAQEHGYTFASV